MGCLSSKDIPYEEQPDNGGQDIARTGSISADSVLRHQYEVEKAHNKNIDKYMENQRRMDARVKKLLLLGAGSSGKSTLFKQLKQIYHQIGLEESEFIESKTNIRNNCINSILVLLKKSEILYEKDAVKHADCHIELESNPAIIEHIRCVLEYATPNSMRVSVDDLTYDAGQQLTKSIAYLWSLPQVKNTFNKRQHFSFVENMDYFFDKIDKVFALEYEPNVEDTLKCRVRTTGQYHEDYMINDVPFQIFDAGGQRNERKKWIKLFEGVTAIIFVAALNHYCTVLFEDECKNGMKESLELFDEICNQKWFRKTEIILFLNKEDLFLERLKEGIPLSVAFGSDWKGPDYVPQEDEKKDEEYFGQCRNEATEFIKLEYEKLNRNPYKKIFVHVTTATNRDNIETVFWDVQNIIVSGNMKISGLA